MGFQPRVAGLLFTVAAVFAAVLSVQSGAALAAPIGETTADFNGDGYGDSAISDLKSGGAVTVLYGSAAGLTAAGSQRWTQDSPGIPESNEGSEFFGGPLATGDFNGDGFTDLAVANELESISGVNNAGSVTVIYGSSAGLTSTGAQLWSQDSAGILDTAEPNDQFGGAVAAGNLGNGPQDDLVIVTDLETLGAGFREGAVHVIYGSPSGLTSTGDQVWTQNSTGISDVSEQSDHFGEVLVVGDFGGGTTEDLAIGVPQEDFEFTGRDGQLTTEYSSGMVHVLYGSTSGVTATGSQVWTQNSSGVLDTIEGGERFGEALATSDLGGTAHRDLAVGAPGENLAAGGVHVLYGSAGSGLSATGNQLWTQDSAGILGGSESGDGFGSALAAGNLGNGAQPDLVVGVPYEAYAPGNTNDGVVHVIYAASTGLVSTGNQLWNQDSPGIAGNAESSDFFGLDLVVNNYGNSVEADLAVGLHLEDYVAGLTSDGIVAVIYGSFPGLASGGNQIWSLDSPGVPGTASSAAFFGDALG